MLTSEDIQSFAVQAATNPHTRKRYRSVLGRFQSYINARNLPLEKVTPDQIQNWLDEIELDGKTRQDAFSTIRVFVLWKCGENHPVANYCYSRRVMTEATPKEILEYAQPVADRRTRQRYCGILKRFWMFLAERKLSWARVTPDQVEAWFNQEGWSRRTRQNVFNILRGYSHWKFGDNHPLVYCIYHLVDKDRPSQKALPEGLVEKLRARPLSALDEVDRFAAEVNTTRKKDYADRTLQIYHFLLKDFQGWAVRHGCVMVDLSPAHARLWVDEKPWGNSMRHLASCAVRAFARWKWGREHDLTRFCIQREESGPQRTLDQHQVERLFERLNGTDAYAVRDRAIIALALDTGLRASELARLRTDQIDFEKMTFSIAVKGGEIQPKVFTEFARDLLTEWLRLRPRVARKAVKTLFVAIRGLKPGAPLTREGLNDIMDRVGLRVGLVALSPHDLRRTMATIASRNGTPDRLIMLQAGWKNNKQLIRYTQALAVEDFRPHALGNRIGRSQTPPDPANPGETSAAPARRRHLRIRAPRKPHSHQVNTSYQPGLD